MRLARGAPTDGLVSRFVRLAKVPAQRGVGGDAAGKQPMGVSRVPDPHRPLALALKGLIASGKLTPGVTQGFEDASSWQAPALIGPIDRVSENFTVGRQERRPECPELGDSCRWATPWPRSALDDRARGFAHGAFARRPVRLLSCRRR